MAPSTSPSCSLPVKIADIFGVPADVQDLVRDFDFTNIKIDETGQREDTLTYELAPSLGALKSQALKTMDDELKIIITATTRAISNLVREKRTWEAIRAAMLQNPVLEQVEPEVVRVNRLERKGLTWFKFTDTPEARIIRDVGIWFDALLLDDDVRTATPINIASLAGVVAATGARVKELLSLATVVQDISREKTVLDIGVLRYPDITHPYFKVYRIKLEAWGYSKNVLGIQSNENGIAGNYTCCKFKPRSEVIAKITKETRDLAVLEAEELLGAST